MKRFWLGTAGALAVVVVVSGVVTYPAWLGMEAWMPERFHFQRVFNRVLMVTTLGIMPLLAMYWRVGWRDVGLVPPQGRGWGRHVGWGFVAGVGMIGLLALWSAGWGHREPRMELTWGRAFGHLASGVGVGVAEEVIFRGFFFYAAWRVLAPGRGVLLAVAGSAVFATVHFFIEVRGVVAEPGWESGWVLWGELVKLMLTPEGLARRWLALFLAGVLLCAVVARQGHVWGAVGLHAGWVFALKSAHRLSRSTGEESLWFAPDLLSGLWASVMLGLALVVVLRVGRRGEVGR